MCFKYNDTVAHLGIHTIAMDIHPQIILNSIKKLPHKSHEFKQIDQINNYLLSGLFFECLAYI